MFYFNKTLDNFFVRLAVWNRTDLEQCFNIRVNTTDACACPALRTCSNRTATTNGTTATGICGHRTGHRCRLFRSECDLVRARCNRDSEYENLLPF